MRNVIVVIAVLAVGVALFVRWREGRAPDRAVTSSPAVGSGVPGAFAALERAPSSVAAWLHLGEQAQRDGHLPLARAAFRGAQELAPTEGTPHARLGFVLYEEGRDDEALVELKRARDKGTDTALLDFTLSMMRSHADLEGPFPRFSADAEERDDDGDDTQAPADDGRSGRDSASEDADDRARDDAPLDDPETGAPRSGEGERDEEGEPDAEPLGAEPEDEPERAPVPEGPRLAARSSQGACELVLERPGGQGIFVVEARVNGVEARLIVDTGASLTVLSREFLDETRLSLREDGVLTARTAGGPRRFTTAEVGAVEVGGRVVEGVRVAICDECGMPGSDGLLGLDVQEPLGLSLFPSRGTVRFADCFGD